MSTSSTYKVASHVKKQLAEAEDNIRNRIVFMNSAYTFVNPDDPPQIGVETITPWLSLTPPGTKSFAPPPPAPKSMHDFSSPSVVVEKGDEEMEKEEELDLVLKLKV